MDYDLFVLTRALHVVGVVVWIGGVSFVTTVLIPNIRKLPDPENRLWTFENIEGKFALQARIVTLITGVSGFYMLHFLDAWDRYQNAQFWWLHLMTFVWVVFTVVLFVLEPLVLQRWFHEYAARNSDRAFALLHGFHRLILAVSLLAVLGAVAGSHGYQF
jgi:uncharacterized membrane protein